MPPPTRLHVLIQAPDGTVTNRWGPDEPDPENTPSAITFSSTMPGGFEQASLTLPRKPDVDYSDLAEFSKVTVLGAGGQVAWQGRLETTPRTSGQQLAISPGLTGYQAALSDNNAAREIYIDCDLARWQGPSVQRQVDLAATFAAQAPAVQPDATTGIPSLNCSFTGPWGAAPSLPLAEGFYDSHGIPIAGLYYAWMKNANVGSGGSWTWLVGIADNDRMSGAASSANLTAAGPGQGLFTPVGITNPQFANVQFHFDAAGGGTNTLYALYWTYLAVIGAHGLAIQGTQTTTGGLGIYASDAVAHAVGKYAPTLALTDAGGNSTITPTTFIIPQLVFTDPTTAAAIVAQATSYGLEDWWVDEGPTFHLAPRDGHGRDWQARVGPSGLQETGPTVDQIYNGAVVTYTDVSGIVRTVGPPGSGANVTDASLYDSDPQNAATAAGLTRNSPPIQLGVSVLAAAIKVGQSFLIFQKQRSTAGQASLVGYVTDTSGVTWPVWMVRAGDRITFVDAHDPVPRRVVRSNYDHASRTNQIDLDSPPQGLQPLLARLASDQVQGLG